MREILFRGKRVENGKWVYGSYVCSKDETTEQNKLHFIFDGEAGYGFSEGLILHRYEVIPETVGQYTGLKDSEGNMIFEGDIIKTKDSVCVGNEKVDACSFVNGMGGTTEMVIGKTTFSVYKEKEIQCVVKFYPSCGYVLSGSSKSICAINNVVVGNIHDAEVQND